MKEDKIAICRLCLSILESGCFEIMDEVKQSMLLTVSPELNLSFTLNPVTCKPCTENLQKVYDFKTDYLYYYYNGIMEIDKDDNIKCLFCCTFNRKMTTIGEDIFLRSIIENCVREVDITDKTAVCETCMEPLQNLHNFITKCTDTESKLQAYATTNNNKENINLFELLQYEGSNINENALMPIKKESEPCDDTPESDKIEVVNIKVEDISQCDTHDDFESIITDNTINNESIKESEESCDRNLTNIEMEVASTKTVDCINEQDQVSEEAKTKAKRTFSTKRSKKIYKCDLCDYQTFRKTDLTLRHILIHKKPEELTMYQCTECPYQSKRRGDLNSHLAKHADSVPVYRCTSCLYKTIHEDRLAEHVLKHSIPEKYQCEFCPYSSPYKKTFSRHMRSHKKPPRKIYRCELCPYQTKRRADLTDKHMLVHKRPEELTMHKCPYCEFQAKHKCSLKKHLIRHTPSEELTTYYCSECSFTTKHKASLVGHVMTHKTADNVVMYKCELCPYEARFKSYLRKHRATHLDETLKCDLCSFQTKNGAKFGKHVKKHVTNVVDKIAATI